MKHYEAAEIVQRAVDFYIEHLLAQSKTADATQLKEAWAILSDPLPLFKTERLDDP